MTGKTKRRKRLAGYGQDEVSSITPAEQREPEPDFEKPARDLPPLPHHDREEEPAEDSDRSSTLSSPSSPEDAQLTVLGALIFAHLGGIPTVEEKSPGILSVSYNNGRHWTIKVDEERVTLGGFPHNPNVYQFVGSIEEGTTLADMIDVASNVSTLVHDAEKQSEPLPPVKFTGSEGGDQSPPQEGTSPELSPSPGSEEEEGEPGLEDMGGLEGDMGMGGEMGAPPMGGPEMGMGAPPMGGPEMGMGAPPMGGPEMGMGPQPPMGAPPMGGGMPPGGGGMPPPNPMGAPPQQNFGMPTASGNRLRDVSNHLKRVASRYRLAGGGVSTHRRLRELATTVEKLIEE